MEEQKKQQKAQQEQEGWQRIAQALDDDEFQKFKEECDNRKIRASDVSAYCGDEEGRKSLQDLGLPQGPCDRLIRSFKQQGILFLTALRVVF